MLGRLRTTPARDRPDLLAPPVVAALAASPDAGSVVVAEIDPALADTAAFCEAYDVEAADSANCVVVLGRRGDQQRWAACVVLATTRADVNGLVRRHLDARRASFAPMDEAVGRTGMAYGGITPWGLPSDWPILVDPAVLQRATVVVGSGIRGSKLVHPGRLLADLPGAVVMPGLGVPLVDPVGAPGQPPAAATDMPGGAGDPVRGG